jgi:hypothetical protein
VAEYARLFQPGWWLIRAGIAAMLIGYSAGLLLVAALLIPLALGSAWLGRRSQADRRWLWAVLPLNAFALAVALLMWDRGAFVTSGSVVYTPSTGATFGNVYPYDSNGRPLTGVFLYDEQGQPITSPYGPADAGCLPPGSVPMPANQFPQPEYSYGPNGECVLVSVTPTQLRPTAGPPPPATSAAPSGTPSGAPASGAATSPAPSSGAPTGTPPPPTPAPTT